MSPKAAPRLPVRPCGRGAHEAHHRVASSVGSARAPGAHPSTYVTFGGFTASVDNSARVPGDVSKRRSRHVGYHSSAQDPEVCSSIINAVSASDAHRCHVPLAAGALGPLRRQGSVMSHSDSDRACHRRLLNSSPARCNGIGIGTRATQAEARKTMIQPPRTTPLDRSCGAVYHAPR